MLPSSSSAVRQLPAPGISPKMSATIARAPPLRASATATGLRSTPSAGTPRALSARRCRPGPQPTSSTGPSIPSSRPRVEPIGGSQVAPNRERQRGPVLESDQRARWPAGRHCAAQRALVERERLPHRIASSVRTASSARANLVFGAWAATASASSIVSTSRSSGWVPIADAQSARRCRCLKVGVRCAHRHPGEGAGDGATEADAPVAAVGGRAEDRVDPSRRRARAPRRRAAPEVTWGVSMPISSAGCATSSNAACSRSPSPTPRWAITSKPSGRQGSGSPSNTSTRRSDGRLGDRVKRVAQRRVCERRGLLRGARRRQARLRAAGYGLLGDHQKRGWLHASQSNLKFLRKKNSAALNPGNRGLRCHAQHP